MYNECNKQGDGMDSLFIGDNINHARELMHYNFNPHDTFMSIRNYNKMLKLHPTIIQKYDGQSYFEHEGRKKLVVRVRRTPPPENKLIDTALPE